MFEYKTKQHNWHLDSVVMEQNQKTLRTVLNCPVIYQQSYQQSQPRVQEIWKKSLSFMVHNFSLYSSFVQICTKLHASHSLLKLSSLSGIPYSTEI